MRKTIFGVLGIGAACAACCTPFLVPLLAATGLSGILALRLGSVSLEYVVCVYGPWIAGAGAALLLLRVAWVVRESRRSAAACACDTTCLPAACRPDGTG